MLSFIIRRILIAIPLLVAASFLVFLVVTNMPGDPCAELDKYKTDDSVGTCAAVYKEGPFVVRYGRYVSRLAHGDMGRDVVPPHREVSEELIGRIPQTIELAVAALLIAFVLGLWVGTRSALKPGTWIDAVGQVLSLGGISIPVFWLGMMLMGLFSIQLGWFPMSGWNASDIAGQDYYKTRFLLFEPLFRLDIGVFLEAARFLFLPALALSTIPLASITRMTRSSILEEVNKDYVTTARAKGVKERRVISKHVRRNALIPIVTITGLQLGTLLSGAVLTEHVFSLSGGLGSYMVDAALDTNHPVLMGCMLLFVTIFIVVNLVVDVLYGLIDPRVRHGGA